MREAKKKSVSNWIVSALYWSQPNQALSKAEANNQLNPKKGLNSKINGRLIYSIRLDPAWLVGFMLFLRQQSSSVQLCDRVKWAKMFGSSGWINMLDLRLRFMNMLYIKQLGGVYPLKWFINWRLLSCWKQHVCWKENIAAWHMLATKLANLPCWYEIQCDLGDLKTSH